MADNDVASVDQPAMDGLSPGAELKKAREKQDKSLDDISKELHLDRWMLEALELDDYNSLGAPVFAKGHLRQYAKLLDIDPADLMVGYYKVCGSREQPPLVADSMLEAQRRNERDWNWVMPVLIGLVVIGIIGGAIYWYMQPTEEPASVGADSDELNLAASAALASNTVIGEPVAQGAAAVPEPVIETVAVETDSLLVPASQVEDTAEEAPVNENSNASSIANNNLAVTLRFSGNSWVEVYDAKRQKLLYGLVDTASVKYLNGPPPISVFLGRQNAVSLEVNGDDYPIPVNALRGNTARFKIEKP
ncbi:MAG: helix-turn-helix domain-containing protein [Gammaproteobacteria bacterium]